MAKTGAVGGRLMPNAWKNWQQKAAKLEGTKLLSFLADVAFTKRAERKEAEAKAAAIGKDEDEALEWIIGKFDEGEIAGLKTRRGSLSLNKKNVPKVTDKEAFGRWVAKNNAWDMLYGKAVEAAVQSRWDDGVAIDGIEKHPVKKLTLTENKEK